MTTPTLQDKMREAQSKGASPSELLLFELNNDQENLISDTTEIKNVLEQVNGDTTEILNALDQINSKEPLSSQLVYGITPDITDDHPVVILPAVEAFYVVTSITISNSHDSQGTWVNVLDNETPIYTVYIPPGTQGMYSRVKIRQAESGRDIMVACETTGANVRASISGYFEEA